MCVLAANGRQYLSEYPLEQLPRFVGKLRRTDQLAVEVTGNTRLFYEAVAPHVAKVVVLLNPTQFRLICKSLKKTDVPDARTLAWYLSQGMLPEVRMKDKRHAQLASLTQTGDTLVKQQTALKNKVNNILSAFPQQMKSFSEMGFTKGATRYQEEIEPARWEWPR